MNSCYLNIKKTVVYRCMVTIGSQQGFVSNKQNKVLDWCVDFCTSKYCKTEF